MRLSQLWLALALLLPVVTSLAVGLATVDLAYQLRAGNLTLDTGRIPTTDTFTFTLAGRDWLNQQWGAQVLFALAERIGGWEGLAVLRALLVGAIFALVLAACRARGAGSRLASVLTLGAFLVAIGTVGLRPQLLGMLLFAASLLIVTVRRERPRAMWLLPLLGIVWANVHGSFFLLPVLVGYAWLEDLHDRVPARATFAVLVASTLSTVVTPFGPFVWRYAVGLSTNPQVTQRITEWQAPAVATIPGALFYASALFVVAVLARRGRTTPWPLLLWLGTLFILAVYAVRGIAWWPLAAAVASAGLLAGTRVDLVRPERASRIPILITALVAAVGVALLPWWRPVSPVTAREGLLLWAPPGVTAQLQTLATPADRIFNPQPWGSWFEWTVPQAPVYIDSRFELFTAEMYDDGIAINEGREDWRSLLDKWAVTIVVVDNERNGMLGDRLERDAGWRRVFGDDDGRIFVRADR